MDGSVEPGLGKKRMRDSNGRGKRIQIPSSNISRSFPTCIISYYLGKDLGICLLFDIHQILKQHYSLDFHYSDQIFTMIFWTELIWIAILFFNMAQREQCSRIWYIWIWFPWKYCHPNLSLQNVTVREDLLILISGTITIPLQGVG